MNKCLSCKLLTFIKRLCFYCYFFLSFTLEKCLVCQLVKFCNTSFILPIYNPQKRKHPKPGQALCIESSLSPEQVLIGACLRQIPIMTLRDVKRVTTRHLPRARPWHASIPTRIWRGSTCWSVCSRLYGDNDWKIMRCLHFWILSSIWNNANKYFLVSHRNITQS